MACSDSRVLRARSVSSMRRTNSPPRCLAKHKFTRATYAVPTCGSPVGDGATLVRTVNESLAYELAASTALTPNEVNNLRERRARRKDGANAFALEFLSVFRRDRSAAEKDDVLRALRLELLDDERKQRHVRARENREADAVGVFLDRGLHDLLRRLKEAGVDDLHPGVAQRARDDLRAAIVPIEARLGDDDAQGSSHASSPYSARRVLRAPARGAAPLRVCS